jgi:hypothetical protein
LQVNLLHEAAAIKLAAEAGFSSVEEYVNQTIKQAAALAAIRDGIDDVRTGRMTSPDEFDKAFREEMNFTTCLSLLSTFSLRRSQRLDCHKPRTHSAKPCIASEYFRVHNSA